MGFLPERRNVELEMYEEMMRKIFEESKRRKIWG